MCRLDREEIHSSVHGLGEQCRAKESYMGLGEAFAAHGRELLDFLEPIGAQLFGLSLCGRVYESRCSRAVDLHLLASSFRRLSTQEVARLASKGGKVYQSS